MNYCNNYSIDEFIGTINTRGSEDVDALYRYLCPILLIGCLIGLILNSILLIVGNLKCRKKSPIFRLSLNLATTDAINSLIVGVGLFINSFLPKVFGIVISNTCSLLVLEIFRLSSLVASALHLLAMALVYYRGTTNPLHYRFSIFYSTHLTRTIHLVSVLCWLIPIFIFTIYFSSVSCQGFQSKNCDIVFMLSLRFRMTITVLFLTPLLVMSFLYARIFSIIWSREQSTNTNRRPTIVLSMLNDNQFRSSIKVDYIDVKADLENKTSPSSRRTSNSQTPSYPRKAVITTLTILGTYVICWIPAVLYFALTCMDGCPYPLLKIPQNIRVIIGFITNAFIIIKAIVDPFIYSLRMKEINSIFNSHPLNSRPVLTSRSSPNADLIPRDQRFLNVHQL